MLNYQCVWYRYLRLIGLYWLFKSIILPGGTVVVHRPHEYSSVCLIYVYTISIHNSTFVLLMNKTM